MKSTPANFWRRSSARCPSEGGSRPRRAGRQQLVSRVALFYGRITKVNAPNLFTEKNVTFPLNVCKWKIHKLAPDFNVMITNFSGFAGFQ
jgi:hypothetical protein